MGPKAAGAGQAVAEEVDGGVHHGGVPLCLKLAEKLQSRLEVGGCSELAVNVLRAEGSM